MITTDLNRAEFSGNNTGKIFVFASGGTNIPVRDETHIKVYVGAVLQTLTQHYTVSFVGTTATVTFVTAPATGTNNILFVREVPFKQETDLVNNSLLEAESLERQLDLIVNQTQQLNEKLGRPLKLSSTLVASDATETHTTLNLSATARANKALRFDASGNIAVTTLDVDSISAQVTAAENAKDDAVTAKGQAETARLAAEGILDNFDDRYLGVKGSDPTVDNDNQTLVDGAIYYSSADDVIKVYDSSLTPTWRQITTTVANQTNIDALVLGKDGTTSTSGTNTNIAQVNTVALNVANVNNFADLYQIDDFDPVPTKDGGGVDALAKGDLAFDTTLNALRVYTGSAWSSGVNTTEGIVVKQEYTANGSTKHFALAHDQDMELVFLNGVKLLSGDGSANNDYFSVGSSSSTTYIGDNNAATHIYFHTAPTNTHVISLVAYGASSNTLAVPPGGGTFTGSVAFSAGLTGTTGVFSGAVSGTTGTFSSTVTGVAGSFSGAVTGSTINGTAVGEGGGQWNTRNVWLGTTILSGEANVAIGQFSLDDSSCGSSNTAVGTKVMTGSGSGWGNSGFGMHALSNKSDGDHNLALGYYSLFAVTDGDKNIGIGFEAGENITTGNRNIMIGNAIDAPAVDTDDHLNIGNALYGTVSTTPNAGSISIGTPTPNASAILDLTSTTKAFLPPRMTATQRDAISSPVDGMMVFVTDYGNGTLFIYADGCWEYISHSCP